MKHSTPRTSWSGSQKEIGKVPKSGVSNNERLRARWSAPAGRLRVCFILLGFFLVVGTTFQSCWNTSSFCVNSASRRESSRRWLGQDERLYEITWNHSRLVSQLEESLNMDKASENKVDKLPQSRPAMPMPNGIVSQAVTGIASQAVPHDTSAKDHLRGMRGTKEVTVSMDELKSSPAAAEEEPLSSEEMSSVLKNMQLKEPLVVCTIANSAFQDMLRNWLLHLQKAGVSNVLVAVLDDETQQLCAEYGVATVSVNTPAHLRGKMFRTTEIFKDFGTLKTLFLLKILELGHDALMSDTDTVWLEDPLPFFSPDGPMPTANILISSDSVSHNNDVASMAADPTVKHGWDSQEWFRNATSRATELFGNVYEHALNTGVLMLRSCPATVAFVREWHLAMKTRGKSQGWERVWGDQHALNQLMRRSLFPIKVVDVGSPEIRNNRVVWASDSQVKLGILPPSLFCNGHVFFVQRIPQTLGLRPLVVHNTFQFHYHWGKTMRYREHGLWAVDPDEYYTKGNFLAFNVTLPERILSLPAGIEKHAAAVKFYFIATRNALAIATVLNRTLILPQVLCFCDRYWHRLEAPCRGPGGDKDPPFVCPLDHYSNPFYWNASIFSYREHSFLASPRVPQHIRSSRRVVRVVPRLELESGMGGKSEAQIPECATDTDVVTALGALSDVRVLHLTSADTAFCRFEAHLENHHFDANSEPMFNEEWCCTPDGKNLRIKLTEKLAFKSQSECQVGALPAR